MRRSVGSLRCGPSSCSPMGRAVCKPARDRDAGDARDVRGYGADVVRVHDDGIDDAADLECRGRRGGERQDVNALEGVVELPADERPHLLGLLVVGIVVSGRERVRSHQDASAHLCAEAVAPRRVQGGPHAVRFLVGVAVLHAVVPGEVRRTLGGREDVVDRKCCPRRGQGDLLDDRALRFEYGERGLHRLRNRRVDAVAEVLRHDADAQSLHAVFESIRVVRRLCGDAGEIQRVGPGDGVEHDRGVLHGTRQGADLVE